MRGQTWQGPVLDFYRESVGAKKKSLEVSVYILDEIIKSFEKEQVGEDYFQNIFKNESSELNLGPRAFYLRNNLTKEELMKSREFLISAYSPPSDFPFIEIYSLAEWDIRRLIELTDGKVRYEMEDLLKGLKAF
jgi:hypothetical protein